GDGVARAHLFLYALEDHDVGVGGHSDREDQPRDPGQGEGDRDELDQRVEVEGVDAEGGHRDYAQDPVEDDQEQRHQPEADRAGDQPLVQGLAAQRGRYVRLRDQLQLDRQRADLEQVGQVLGALDGEAPGDLGPGPPVDAVRVLVEVDVGPGDELVVQHDREVLE